MRVYNIPPKKELHRSLQVHEDLLTRTDDRSLSENTRRHIAGGFLVFDWFAIPQITSRKDGVNETAKSDAALAIKEHPGVCGACEPHCKKVPELTQNDSAKGL